MSRMIEKIKNEDFVLMLLQFLNVDR
jgi:hypothetical protein